MQGVIVSIARVGFALFCLGRGRGIIACLRVRL